MCTGYGAGDLVEDWIDAKGEANIPESLGKRVAAGLSLVRDSDKAPLVSLLSDPRLCLSRAVVHSRGSLLLSQSLRSGIESQLTEVLSLGLVAYFPSRFCCTQYLGTLDMVGQAMSKTKLPHRTLENCGHHLNPWVAGAIPLEAILTELAWANSSA